MNVFLSCFFWVLLSPFECFTDLSPWEHSWPLLHPSGSERWWSQSHVTGHSSCPERSLCSPERRTSRTPAKATKNCKTDWIRRQCCGTVTIFYGSGSDIWQVTAPVSAPYLAHKKHSLKNFFEQNLALSIVSFFIRKRLVSFHLIYCKMWMKKMLHEGNQLHNFILWLWELLWFHFITVPVPLRPVIKLRFRFRYTKKLRLLRFRYRNTEYGYLTYTNSKVKKNIKRTKRCSKKTELLKKCLTLSSSRSVV